MTDPDTVLAGIERALRDDPSVPADVSYVLHAWDRSGTDARVDPPAVEIQATDVPMTATGPTRAGTVTDDAGGPIGFLYEYPHTASIQSDVYTVAGSDYDATALGTTVRQALRRYDAHGRGDPLLADDGTALADVGDVLVGDGRRRDDLTTNASLHRWIQELTVDFTEVVNGAEAYGPMPYATAIDWAKPGEMGDGAADEPEVVYDPS